jgi:mannose-6-phosphate isomerase class I
MEHLNDPDNPISLNAALDESQNDHSLEKLRMTEQFLAPLYKPQLSDNAYDLYPAFPASGELNSGFEALANIVSSHKIVAIDGYVGVFFERIKAQLDNLLLPLDKKVFWYDAGKAMKDAYEIEKIVTPFLGGNDPLFGTRCTLKLIDFFEPDRLKFHKITPVDDAIHIIIGCGAALLQPDAFLIYIDLPKNELQFRARAGSISNLGAEKQASQKETYKRFYFVDWIVLNLHKQHILQTINLIVDGQRPAEPVMMNGDAFRKTLSKISCNYFRVRPWFEPGAWGGHWIESHIQGLAKNVPNYAWSFELIVPENGLMIEQAGLLLEVSFDFLMYHDAKAVLGDAEKRFGVEFPIRFDFLDTMEGGNLSVQCHPRTEYMKDNFGENFTQDETYYILDADKDAKVYLGLQEFVEPSVFRRALEESSENIIPVEIEKFVQVHPASKHDLFLIPGGTVHGAGKGNMVLEISSTPYIFTFKMYDWLRLDLDGKPRTLNIGRAFENIDFTRKGEKIRNKFISKPVVIERGKDWELIHFPTHANHFYDVHRLDFSNSVQVSTENECHILMLVEGEQIILETANGMQQLFHYAETFVVPAACENYRLINRGSSGAKVIKAFVKPSKVVFV